ncbi:MAG: hypothetical protein HY236_04630 [Acidobacteria bacterium]|nr:hypothetical protein [Acidobacteriota bacterium]
MSIAIETPTAPISEWKVVKGGLIVSIGLLTSQVLGFFRQATIAYLLGTGPQADALAVAFAPVDLWWSVLSTAVVFGFGPLLAARRVSHTGPAFDDIWRPVVRVAFLIAAVFLFFAEVMVRLLAPGLPPATAQLAAHLLRITALAIPAMSSSTLFTALLYSERRFAFPAFQQAAVNLGTMMTALLVYSLGGAQRSVFGFAAGYAGGAWLQLAGAFAISRPFLHCAPTSGRVKLWKLLSEPAPVLCYSMLIGLNPVVTRALASTHGPGATAAFDYCLKLLGVPLALLVIPLSSSLLTEIAPYRLRRDRREALGAIGRAGAAIALASSAIVLVMIAIGPWVVAFLFERGMFGAASTSTVSALLAGFFPALAAWSVLDLISRSLFSLGRPRISVLAAALALGVNALISLAVPFGSVRWIGLGAVIGFTAAALLLVGYLWGPAFLPLRWSSERDGTEPANPAA